MPSNAKAPSALLLGLEPLRACFEAMSLLMGPSNLSQGSGQPVIVYPGLATNEKATALFRSKLQAAGFTVYDWGQGLNRGPQGEFEEWIALLARQVHRLEIKHGQPVALVGWSLGGIFAREVARRMPDKASQVVTLGTPFAANAGATNAGKVYEALNGKKPEPPKSLLTSLRKPLPVPSTSVYSRTDGVVAWECCVERETDISQNIELNQVSHLGMVLHPQVLRIVADRLAQPHGAWARYGQENGKAPKVKKQSLAAA